MGAEININKNTHLYADVEASDGAKADAVYRVNFGVRYSF
ncbi:MAG: autotransporter outer membrane beta-barrel domain-containing protein [Sutterella sp.]|nr:autotransporter outer membrane beta-barrel domain-containing protein [Sutterella sp.]MDD7426847.1 autotransporter outer membrane beta-barrel domain-containing protein [Sutterella sp.]MDY3274102.1 autotransporter outer membrane beta-barrel domain-containing protein [Duodenibacillus sp.]